MNPLDALAEEKLRAAIAAGKFDSLAGFGRPLELEDLSQLDEDLRAAYLLLRGAGVLPEELSLRKEVLALDDLLRACSDAAERLTLGERRRALALRYDLWLESRRARRRGAS